MRRIILLCPCGGEIGFDLECRKCDSIFESAPTLILIKRGRDDSVLEGSFAKNTTQVVQNEQRPTVEPPTVR